MKCRLANGNYNKTRLNIIAFQMKVKCLAHKWKTAGYISRMKSEFSKTGGLLLENCFVVGWPVKYLVDIGRTL